MNINDCLSALIAATSDSHERGISPPLVAAPAAAFVDAYVSASVSERESIQLLIPRPVRLVLLDYAWQEAERAVQQASPDRVMSGLRAVCIEQGRIDLRDSILRLTVLQLSADKLGLAFDQQVQAAAAIATDVDFQNLVRTFPMRSPDEKGSALIEEDGGGAMFHYRYSRSNFGRAVRRSMWRNAIHKLFHMK